MKTVLITVIVVFYSFRLSGQTLYALKIDGKIRSEAVDITAKYQPRLVMGTEQALEFQGTIAKFLVKKKAIENDDSLSPMAKYELFKQLSSKETMDMADVLESYRLREYIRIKPQIQPILKPTREQQDIWAATSEAH
ncbi:hypothetical protein NYZ99_09845 [Maribacter litopenaei]|uniref:Peptidylprolyl isomerase n=1 Tax=Maribacter litopenaei TaxID=2976127 RepID=A0ABY5YBN7_9FLAO|nr:hypothetical protein [Maribacter litopenaei]UWX56457.1 hypothetical protein NYZ99_09845 [Maribacter litopenaei]